MLPSCGQIVALQHMLNKAGQKEPCHRSSQFPKHLWCWQLQLPIQCRCSVSQSQMIDLNAPRTFLSLNICSVFLLTCLNDCIILETQKLTNCLQLIREFFKIKTKTELLTFGLVYKKSVFALKEKPIWHTSIKSVCQLLRWPAFHPVHAGIVPTFHDSEEDWIDADNEQLTKHIISINKFTDIQ